MSMLRKMIILMLATYATALVVVPVVTPAKAAVSNGRHLKKHKKQNRAGFSYPGQAWPGNRPSPAGAVCPGNARAIDCRVWPPPIEDDPDRKVSGTDA
jgi:hypothetical protein